MFFRSLFKSKNHITLAVVLLFSNFFEKNIYLKIYLTEFENKILSAHSGMIFVFL